jgi:hypothetical protein
MPRDERYRNIKKRNYRKWMLFDRISHHFLKKSACGGAGRNGKKSTHREKIIFYRQKFLHPRILNTSKNRIKKAVLEPEKNSSKKSWM